MKVAILGASDKPNRYAHRAQQMLMNLGHETFPVSADGKRVLDRDGYRSLLEIAAEDRPHTVTVYLNPQRLAEVTDDITKLGPDRVIFNPGSESAEVAKTLRDHGIDVVEACTLVLLQTGQFE